MHRYGLAIIKIVDAKSEVQKLKHRAYEIIFKLHRLCRGLDENMIVDSYFSSLEKARQQPTTRNGRNST